MSEPSQLQLRFAEAVVEHLRGMGWTAEARCVSATPDVHDWNFTISHEGREYPFAKEMGMKPLMHSNIAGIVRAIAGEIGASMTSTLAEESEPEDDRMIPGGEVTRCGNCFAFEPPEIPEPGKNILGTCRLKPPVVIRQGVGGLQDEYEETELTTSWPWVNPGDWCTEFRPGRFTPRRDREIIPLDLSRGPEPIKPIQIFRGRRIGQQDHAAVKIGRTVQAAVEKVIDRVQPEGPPLEKQAVVIETGAGAVEVVCRRLFP